ncbi:MAG TPA: hypothetical protein ENJ44_05635, partial [Oceanospirillales bacterium]|nr:hypothetical protein [Oceanospirillales bacterium]
MKSCLICKNTINHKKYQTICEGCVNLLRHADFCCSRCAVSLPMEQFEQHEQHENIHKKRLCGQCQLKPPAFSSVAYVTVYQEPINHWIMSLKFG